jgi:N-acetylmuramoyl-L-alanine amidase
LKKISLLSCFLLLLLSGNSFPTKQRKYEIKTVVIDAGHGGHDTGCLGASGKEKDVALEIALKLGKLIQDNFPGIKVVYTRKTDVFVELHERAEIANRNKADLFICIHANSGGNAYGTETFVLGLHRAEENLAVSRRENSAILMEKDYKTKYDGFDPNSAEANIIFRLYQSTYLQQSLLFAAKVQDQLNDFAGRLNRGVKQAGLLVLARTSMPAVLIETGFLTNKGEEKYLLSSKGQSQVATAVYRAFREYKIDMEETPDAGRPDSTRQDTSGDQPKPVKDTVAKQAADTGNRKQDEDLQTHNAVDPLPPVKQPSKSNPPKKEISTNNDAAKAAKDTAPIETTVEVQPVKTVPVTKTAPEKKENPADVKEVFFTVQLGATENPTTRDRDRFKKIEDIRERVGEDGMTRFTAGTYFSLDKAILGQNDMRAKGFKDAFVSAYYKNKRITIKEAVELIKVK